MEDHKNNTLPNIRRMAEETYQAELVRERQERAWALGKNLPPPSFVKQQQEIMDKFKSTNNTATNPTASNANIGTTSSTSTSASAQAHSRSDASGNTPQFRPRAESRPQLPKPPVSFPVQEYPIPVLPPELEERRRASDLHGGTSTKNRDEFLNSLRRPPWVSTERDQRLPLPDGWGHSASPVPTTDNSDPQRPSSTSASSIRSKPSLSEVRMSPSNTSPTKSSGLDRSRTSSDRHLATSPPTGKSLHEIWKPPISPEEDAAAANKHYSVGRRNSNASMRSISSATSALRPPAAETIPERADDARVGDVSPPDRKGKGKERMHSSAAAAAAGVANPSPPPYGPPTSTTSVLYTRPPDDHSSRERDRSNNFTSYPAPQPSSRSSHSSLNGDDERERYPTSAFSAAQVRESEYDDRFDRHEPLDFMNGTIAGPGYDSYESTYPRTYRPNLPRSTSYTRPPPSLRDDHDRREGEFILPVERSDLSDG